MAIRILSDQNVTSNVIAIQAFRLGTDSLWKIRGNSASTELAFEYSTSSALSDANIKVVFNSSGDVGIGDNVTPSQKLHVAGNIYSINSGTDLDINAMRRASKFLLGEKDFSSFRGSGCQSNSPVREITDIKIAKQNEFVSIDITANSFLLNMVRIMVGTLILVGQKDITASKLNNIIESKDRRLSGKTVSADGLYFIGPQYPQQFKIPSIENSVA